MPYNIYWVEDKHLIIGVATDLQFIKLAKILRIKVDSTNESNKDRVENRNRVND